MACRDDDDEEYEALYTNGHWVWDDKKDELKFINDLDFESHTTTLATTAAVLTGGAVRFRDDLDVIEQIRFRKRIQRKITGPDDVVTLQDVKDLVMYLAPLTLINLTVVKIFHTSSGERFLRALIMYCQLYLETLEIMEYRTLEQEKKIPTDNTEKIEAQYQENLNDLRLLTAKEYSMMIQGTGDFFFHHKGKDKKQKTLSRKGALIFEALLRISVQVVWVALARRQYTHIDLEVNRLFRSKKFNLVEHNLKLDLESQLTANQRKVLHGECYKPIKTLYVHSPFYNEIHCKRDVDFRMLGLGIIKYPKDSLNERLRYLEALLIMPETMLQVNDLNLGIIGLKRAKFDTMLREIIIPIEDKSKSKTSSSTKALSKAASSRATSVHSQKSEMTTQSSKSKYYPPLFLPENIIELQPSDFVEEEQTRMALNTRQARRWLALVISRKKRRSTSTYSMTA